MSDPSKPNRTSEAPAGPADEVWANHGTLIRDFLRAQPQCARLCEEVAFILQTRLTASQIEVASVTARVKSLDSFLRKIQRHTFESPVHDMADLSGARVVCLYREDIERISAIVVDEFEVLESVDALHERDIEHLGEGARRFVVRLSRRHAGARYDDLRQGVCEIQVRTVLQDAWETLVHRVEQAMGTLPPQVERKLVGLSGLLEAADDQFQKFHALHETHQRQQRQAAASTADFLNTPLNLGTLREYLVWKMPDRMIEKWEGQLGMIFKDWDASPYRTLRDIDELFACTEKAREEIAASVPSGGDRSVDKPYSAVEFAWAAALRDPKLRCASAMPPVWRVEIIKQLDGSEAP